MRVRSHSPQPRSAGSSPGRTPADRRHEHLQGETVPRGGAGVHVSVGQVTGERSRISLREYLGVLAHSELKLTVKDEEQLTGSRRVRLAGVTLTRPERPVPQLGDVRWLRAGDEHGLPAEFPPPQHRGSASPGDPQPGRTVHTDKRGQPYAERVTDPKQRRDARISRALLDADQHSAADAGALGQLVQGPAPAAPSLPAPAADRPGDAVRPGTSLQI